MKGDLTPYGVDKYLVGKKAGVGLADGKLLDVDPDPVTSPHEYWF